MPWKESVFCSGKVEHTRDVGNGFTWIAAKTPKSRWSSHILVGNQHPGILNNITTRYADAKQEVIAQL